MNWSKAFVIKAVIISWNSLNFLTRIFQENYSRLLNNKWFHSHRSHKSSMCFLWYFSNLFQIFLSTWFLQIKFFYSSKRKIFFSLYQNFPKHSEIKLCNFLFYFHFQCVINRTELNKINAEQINTFEGIILSPCWLKPIATEISQFRKTCKMKNCPSLMIDCIIFTFY